MIELYLGLGCLCVFFYILIMTPNAYAESALLILFLWPAWLGIWVLYFIFYVGERINEN